MEEQIEIKAIGKKRLILYVICFYTFCTGISLGFLGWYLELSKTYLYVILALYIISWPFVILMFSVLMGSVFIIQIDTSWIFDHQGCKAITNKEEKKSFLWSNVESVDANDSGLVLRLLDTGEEMSLWTKNGEIPKAIYNLWQTNKGNINSEQNKSVD